MKVYLGQDEPEFEYTGEAWSLYEVATYLDCCAFSARDQFDHEEGDEDAAEHGTATLSFALKMQEERKRMHKADARTMRAVGETWPTAGPPGDSYRGRPLRFERSPGLLPIEAWRPVVPFKSCFWQIYRAAKKIGKLRRRERRMNWASARHVWHGAKPVIPTPASTLVVRDATPAMNATLDAWRKDATPSAPPEDTTTVALPCLDCYPDADVSFGTETCEKHFEAKRLYGGRS